MNNTRHAAHVMHAAASTVQTALPDATENWETVSWSCWRAKVIIARSTANAMVAAKAPNVANSTANTDAKVDARKSVKKRDRNTRPAAIGCKTRRFKSDTVMTALSPVVVSAVIPMRAVISSRMWYPSCGLVQPISFTDLFPTTLNTVVYSDCTRIAG